MNDFLFQTAFAIDQRFSRRGELRPSVDGFALNPPVLLEVIPVPVPVLYFPEILGNKLLAAKCIRITLQSRPEAATICDYAPAQLLRGEIDTTRPLIGPLELQWRCLGPHASIQAPDP